MLTTIQIIKAKFEMIKIVLANGLTAEDLSEKRYLRALIDASENTYITLNDSICESLIMCKECANKREILMKYINILDDIDEGHEITFDIAETLTQYPEAIQGIIDRINTVLIDMQA